MCLLSEAEVVCRMERGRKGLEWRFKGRYFVCKVPGFQLRNKTGDVWLLSTLYSSAK